MTHRPIFGAIADDLTGGMELAAMLVGQGANCVFVTDVDSLTDLASEAPALDAIIVALKIRIAPAEYAVAQAAAAAEAFISLGVRQIFYKYCATFDSTDLGNIGPIADRLADRLQSQSVLFCPSFPDVGVTVFAGHQFRFDTLMSNTAKRDDPVTPMTDPDLCAVLRRQSRNTVGVLGEEHILRGFDAVGNEIEAQRAAGRRYVIADTIRNEDLRVLAKASVDAPLLTGNSSIAEHLPALWREKGWSDSQPTPCDLPPVLAPGIVLAGSCADQTIAQLKAFEAHAPVLHINPGESVDDVVYATLDWVRGQGGSPCAIATSAEPDTVRALQDQFGRAGASARVDEIFERLATQLVEMGVRRFLVAGGETAGTVVRALGLRRLQIGAYSGPGPVLAISAGDDPLSLCLKSGKLGHRDMFWHTLERMAGRRVTLD